MQQVPDSDTARAFAQELVEKTKELKALSDKINLLKLELYDAAKGGIYVQGGRVQFVDEGLSVRFDKAAFKSQLVAKFCLTDEQAEEFLESCKSQSARAPFIAVFLD